MSWLAYICSQRGWHERRGSKSGEATFWSPYCAICGAWIGHPTPAEDGESNRKETEPSVPSP